MSSNLYVLYQLSEIWESSLFLASLASPPLVPIQLQVAVVVLKTIMETTRAGSFVWLS